MSGQEKEMGTLERIVGSFLLPVVLSRAGVIKFK